MAGQKTLSAKAPLRTDIQTKLSDMLDFGSDRIEVVSNNNTTERLKKIVKQLKDLSNRIDKLHERV